MRELSLNEIEMVSGGNHWSVTGVGQAILTTTVMAVLDLVTILAIKV